MRSSFASRRARLQTTGSKCGRQPAPPTQTLRWRSASRPSASACTAAAMPTVSANGLNQRRWARVTWCCCPCSKDWRGSEPDPRVRSLTRFPGFERQAVDNFVFPVAGMPAGPAPADVVLRRQAQELLPQVPVPDGLTAGGFPAVFLPVVEPAVGEGFFQVLTVRRDRHAARLPQGLERPDG